MHVRRKEIVFGELKQFRATKYSKAAFQKVGGRTFPQVPVALQGDGRGVRWGGGGIHSTSEQASKQCLFVNAG